MSSTSASSDASAPPDPSDEPTRVDRIVSRFFGKQSGTEVAHIDETTVTLVCGADKKDDCAVYDISGPVTLVFGSDYVRGPKFRLYEIGLLSAFDLGYYLVVANLSDIAAMGAVPIGLTTVVRYSHDVTDADFESILAGIYQAAADHGALNVGGDIGGAERIILSASAIGVCELGHVLTRAGAESGDLLCVTGPLGTAGAAVAYFGSSSIAGRLSGELEDELLAAWRRPVARVAEGRILASRRLASACQDVSDGLKATVEQLGSAGGVGFCLEEGALPISSSTREVARLLDTDPTALALERVG